VDQHQVDQHQVDKDNNHKVDKDNNHKVDKDNNHKVDKDQVAAIAALENYRQIIRVIQTSLAETKPDLYPAEEMMEESHLVITNHLPVASMITNHLPVASMITNHLPVELLTCLLAKQVLFNQIKLLLLRQIKWPLLNLSK
jgi:hypothetical protein